MDIKVKAWRGYKEDIRFAVIVDVDNARVEEDWLSQEEVDSLALSFIEDTVLHDVCRDGVIERLIGIGLIDLEMIMDYAKEIEDGDL